MLSNSSHLKAVFIIQKKFLTVLGGFLFIVFFTTSTNAQELSIQKQIQNAKAGEKIELILGNYEENIVIDKPIHLVGSEGVILTEANSRPVITINSNNVILENIQIKHEARNSESPAILINSDYNTLHHINIETSGNAILLDEANHNRLSHLRIKGNKDTLMQNRQHGIDIWKSHNNEINHSTISHVKDGIYIERSNDTIISNNRAFQSRYGYHLMFTKNTLLKENDTYENISGMMVMGANGTIVENNQLTKNQKNIQSLGLLVFDTVHATIRNNHIADNRIGVFIEDAQKNELTFNTIQQNYVGVQFKSAKHNLIHNNAFIANVVHGQAKDSSDNNTNNNYWGDYAGIDVTGDKISNLPYKVNPFFLDITNEFPPFQLLFQSPGMIFLEQLIHTPLEQQLVDQAPLLESDLTLPDDLNDKQRSVLFICLTIFTLSIIIIYLGVKVNEKV